MTLPIQIKPFRPTVYFAGKISKHGWRESIAGPWIGDHDERRLWDPYHRLDCGRFLYGGPFFVACDHGCGHRLNAHGSNGGLGCTCVDDNAETLHKKVWDVNCARIRGADLVFAYINETDCFGTMAEIGFAAGVNKAVFLALGPGLTEGQRADLWLLQMPATKVYGGTADFAWQWVCRDLGLTSAPIFLAHPA